MGFVNSDEAIRIDVRQRTNGHAVRHGKNCGRRPDAQCEGRHSGRRKSWPPAKAAQRQTQILTESLERAETPFILRGLANAVPGTEAPRRSSGGLSRIMPICFE